MQISETKILISTTALLAVLASASFAQDAPVVAANAADDFVENLEENIKTDFEKNNDRNRFGNRTVPEGWRGSFAASASAKSGNSDASSASIGSRFSYGQGPWEHNFVLGYYLSKPTTGDEENKAFASYDVNRTINDRLYGYGRLRMTFDSTKIAQRQDHFVGLGLGYRIFNNANTAWRVQAGPGWRVTKNSDQHRTAPSKRTEEAAGLISSYYYHKINKNVFLTNDTDILSSSSDTSVTNDFGMTVSMGGPLSLRTSILSEYNSDPGLGLGTVTDIKSANHTFGVSLVYTFR